MGKAIMGGDPQVTGQVDMLTPQQQQYLTQALGGYSQMAQGMNPKQMQGAFQKSVVDPTMKQYEQQVLPSIQQRFVDADAGSSSALNQALTQSASDVTTGLGSQYLNFLQGQQSNQLNALQGMGGLAGQQTFQPMVNQNQGLLGPLLQALGQMGGGYMMGKRF